MIVTHLEFHIQVIMKLQIKKSKNIKIRKNDNNFELYLLY